MKKKLLALYTRLSKREKLVFFATLFILTALFGDRLVVGPVYRHMTLLDKDIREEENAIRKSLHVLIQKERISAEGRQFMAYSVEAKNPEEEMVGLLKEIQTMADHAAVSLSYVKPANTQESEGTKKYFSTLECEAQMEQIATFFHQIESSTKLLKIEKYEIQPKSKDSSIARCAMTVSKTVLS